MSCYEIRILQKDEVCYTGLAILSNSECGDNMADLDEEFINDIHNSYEEDTPEVVGPKPGTDDPLANPSRPPTSLRTLWLHCV
eukprot:g9628.t1